MNNIEKIVETLGFIKEWMHVTSEQISAIDEIIKAMGDELVELRKTVDEITRKS